VKIIAYVALGFRYFGMLVPKISKYHEITLFPFFEILKKLGPDVTPETYAVFLEHFLSQENYDGLWSYARPDEITLDVCYKNDVPVLIQEHFGHYPFNIDSLFPAHCDFEKLYDGRERMSFEGRPRENPVITYCLSKGIYDVAGSSPEVLKNNYSGKDEYDPYWFKDEMLTDYKKLVEVTAEFVLNMPELSDCLFYVRPHPRYPEIFREAVEFAESIGDKRVKVDRGPVADSIERTDIAVTVRSNYGFDAFRAGREVITMKAHAFYAHPQLTVTAHSKAGYLSALSDSARKIRRRGRRPKWFLPYLIESLRGPMSSKCLEPYSIRRLSEAIEYGVKISRPKVKL
jgi:hypothetical protein